MIIPMSVENAAQICGWIYENEYSIYRFDQNDETLLELTNGEYYACLDTANDLTGYFCFGKSAQIPAIENEVYTPEILDIGLRLKPVRCGKGYGSVFVKSGLDFAQKKFNIRQIRPTVAEFNIRAIRVYQKIGFQYSSSSTHRKNYKKFMVMLYLYSQNGQLINSDG